MMEKKSTSNLSAEDEFLKRVELYQNQGELSSKIADLLRGLFFCYRNAMQDHKKSIQPHLPLFFEFLEEVKKQERDPSIFEPYHKKVTSPYNYQKFGIDFIKPLICLEESYVHGVSHIQEIARHIKEGHNVILFANHQIEPDPQVMTILLEPIAKELIDSLIFVAGERVLTDPIAIPFSLGCNLLCIYSKRYIDSPPEKKEQKQSHNAKTMKIMKSLLDEGGKCIYVAPSGGRDRPSEDGSIRPAAFDPQSIEMFYLISKHAKSPTFFYPLALSTYPLLPPPNTIQKELGEKRLAQVAPIHMAIGPQIAMDGAPMDQEPDKHLRRTLRASYIYDLMCKEYEALH